MIEEISERKIEEYVRHLRWEEKSELTVSKYVRDVRSFKEFADGRKLSKELTSDYKRHLVVSGKYRIGSINSMLASLNSLFHFLGREDCKVRNIRVQRTTYCLEDRKLDKEEYVKLHNAARSRPRLMLILETLFNTGIRISELRYFTVEALSRKEISVSCKNKTRTIIVPRELRDRLLSYAKKSGITTGAVFCTRSGNPVDRSNVWQEMKKLCEIAGVQKSKVFPHNLRKMFARMYYKRWRDIAQLADLLGHSSINTTRIYIMTTVSEIRSRLEQMVKAEEKDKKINTTLSA